MLGTVDYRTTRPFFWTVTVFLAVGVGSWFEYRWLFERWSLLFLELNHQADFQMTLGYPIGYARYKIAIHTATLAAFPVFHAEGWRVLCRLKRAEHALSFTLPVAACAACAAVLTVWLVSSGVRAYTYPY